jgi:hypothetical protein
MDIVSFIICVAVFIYLYKSVVKLKLTSNKQIFELNERIFELNERVDNLARHLKLAEEFSNTNFELTTDVLHTHELMIDKLEQTLYHNYK